METVSRGLTTATVSHNEARMRGWDKSNRAFQHVYSQSTGQPEWAVYVVGVREGFSITRVRCHTMVESHFQSLLSVVSLSNTNIEIAERMSLHHENRPQQMYRESPEAGEARVGEPPRFIMLICRPREVGVISYHQSVTGEEGPSEGRERNERPLRPPQVWNGRRQSSGQTFGLWEVTRGR